MLILAVFVNPENVGHVGRGFGAVATSCMIAAFMESFVNRLP